MIKYRSFHFNEDTSIAGWFISWNTFIKLMITRGTPMTQESLHMVKHEKLCLPVVNFGCHRLNYGVADVGQLRSRCPLDQLKVMKYLMRHQHCRDRDIHHRPQCHAVPPSTSDQRSRVPKSTALHVHKHSRPQRGTVAASKTSPVDSHGMEFLIFQKSVQHFVSRYCSVFPKWKKSVDKQICLLTQ